MTDTGAGNPDPPQVSRDGIPRNKFRPILWNFQLDAGAIGLVRYQASKHQATGRDPVGPCNYNVMMAYVESGENLKLCMKLLRDDRKMVQYEGFHVFKVCVRRVRNDATQI